MAKKKKSVKNSTKKQKSTQAELAWLPRKTFELKITLPWAKVKEAYNQTLQDKAAGITIKGFRKGKAPLKLVEEKLDRQELYQGVLTRLLPEAYQQAIQKHHLSPIIAPQIKPLSIKENEDWQFQALACERPEVKLGDYQQKVKGALAKENIWTPAKGKPDEETKKKKTASYDQKLKIVTQTLLTEAGVELPEILIKDELKRMLANFLDQVNALGMTLQDYLASKGITNQQLRENYRDQAEKTLKLEFILQAVIQDREIKVAKEEIDKMIAAAQDKKTKERLEKPAQRAYISSILAKRKVLDYLTNL